MFPSKLGPVAGLSGSSTNSIKVGSKAKPNSTSSIPVKLVVIKLRQKSSPGYMLGSAGKLGPTISTSNPILGTVSSQISCENRGEINREKKSTMMLLHRIFMKTRFVRPQIYVETYICKLFLMNILVKEYTLSAQYHLLNKYYY